MHLETLLYMLLQSDKTVPPPGVKPDFEALAHQAERHAVPNQWIKVPASEITIGLDDPENDEGPDRYFGWDNEKSAHKVHVAAFEAKARGLTNADFAMYLKETNKNCIPASWIKTVEDKSLYAKNSRMANGIPNGVHNGNVYMNGDSKALTDAFLNGKAVRTVYGPVPLAYALDWPVIASYDELAGCAKWMNGRIPTMEETRSLYNYVDQLTSKESSGVSARTIPAVNGYAHPISIREDKRLTTP